MSVNLKSYSYSLSKSGHIIKNISNVLKVTGTFPAGLFSARSFRRRFFPPTGFFPADFYFSSYEEKTMKQEIPWMQLSANLFRLESSILTRAKRATNRNNVATENKAKKTDGEKTGGEKLAWKRPSEEKIQFCFSCGGLCHPPPGLHH